MTEPENVESRAIEVAATRGHNILVTGVPVTGTG
jgi:predicted ATPase with chaperone activity